jgi:hypothetical protein
LLSSVTFNGEPAIVYADSKSGDLNFNLKITAFFNSFT